MTKHTHTPADPSIVHGSGGDPDTATCAGCGKTIAARFGEPWRLAKTATPTTTDPAAFKCEHGRFIICPDCAKTERILSIEASHDRINDAIEGLARAERELAHAVFAARNNGCTWQRIGDDLGVSRSAAHQRFGSTFDTPED
jgi:hypothetical protein